MWNECGESQGRCGREWIKAENRELQSVLISWRHAAGRGLGASGGPDLCELAGEKGIAVEGVGNLFNAVDNGGVVTVAQEKADPLEGEMRVLSE